MPGPQTPAIAGAVLPPISGAAIVDQNGHLTPVGLNLFQQIWAGVFGSGGIAEQFFQPGDLKPIAGSAAQSGWLLCDGTAYSTSLYPTLFTAIGTTWGTGGPGTFRVPNLKGRFVLGADGSHIIGATGGALTVTLAKANLPSYALTVTDPGHTHTVTDPGHTHTITDPGHHHSGGSTPSNTNTAGTAAGTSTAANTGTAETGITINSADTGVTNQDAETGITVASDGSDTPLDIAPPYAAINWLIKT